MTAGRKHRATTYVLLLLQHLYPRIAACVGYQSSQANLLLFSPISLLRRHSFEGSLTPFRWLYKPTVQTYASCEM